MPTAYATLAELRAQIDKQSNDAGKPSSDVNLQLMLDAAADAIDGICNRPDGFSALATAVARLYPGSGEYHQHIDECAAITLVEVKASPTDSTYVSWATADWIAFAGEPDEPNFNPASFASPRPYTGLMSAPAGSRSYFTSGRYRTREGFPPDHDRGALARVAVPTVRVTAKWGYAVVVPKKIKEACIAQASIWLKRGEGAWSTIAGSSDFGQTEFKQQLDPAILVMLKLARLVRPPVG